jgi:DNA-binding transcriptional LysR family regulator
MSVELRHLRCFVTVAECGQISAAAERMHLAQPALSQTIRQLERELGVELFRRHPRGVSLSEAGTDLLPPASAAIRSCDEGVALARAHARSRRHELRIGFLPPFTDVALRILAAYERDQPATNVSVRQLDFDKPMCAVGSRAVDVAFIWAGLEESGVVIEPLVEEPCAICVSTSHPLAHRRQVHFAEIEDEPLPRVPDDFPRDVHDLLHLARYRRRPMRMTDELPLSMEEGIWLIAAGHAICVGPISLARSLCRTGMVVIPVCDVDPFMIAIARRHDDRRAMVRALGRVAQEVLQEGSKRERAAVEAS